MMKLIIFVLFISTFAHGSSYFWSCGNTAGSMRFWNQGVVAGSQYYWEKGEGPGSRYYWDHGTGYGSKYYYQKNSGAWTSYSYQRESGPGSFYYWNRGEGPGSRYFFENGYGASADGVITALCMQNLIAHPLCQSIRQNRNNHFCVNDMRNQFQMLEHLINTPINGVLECIELNEF